MLFPSLSCRSSSCSAMQIRAAASRAVGGSVDKSFGRMGTAQHLAVTGMEVPALMQAGRWKSSRMPARYTEGQAAARWPGITRAGTTRAGITRGRGGSHSKTGRQGQKAGIRGKRRFLSADSGRVLRRGVVWPRARISATPPPDGRQRGGLTRTRARDYYRLANHQGRRPRRIIVCRRRNRRRNRRRSPVAPNRHRGISSEMATVGLSPRHRGKVLKVSALDRVISTRAGSGFTVSSPCPQLPPAARQGRPAATGHAPGFL